MNRFALMSAVVAVWVLATPASAQTDEEQARAQELFEIGVEHSEAGRFAEAAHSFEESYDLFSHPGTLVNLAGALEDAGRRAEALARWNELLERFGAVVSNDARTRARQRVAALERALARVTVTSAPTGATLLCDGRELGTSPLGEPIYLEPGDHVFEARLEGYQDHRREVFLRSGPNNALNLQLQPARETSEPAPPPGDGVDLTPSREVLEGGEGAEGEPDEPGQVDAVDAASPDGDMADGVETGERRGFWRGPWPWIIGGVLVAGAGAGVGVYIWQLPEDPNITLRMR